MKIVFAGAFFAVAALIANASLADEAPGAASLGQIEETSSEPQPCISTGAELEAVAAMLPSGSGEGTDGQADCPVSAPAGSLTAPVSAGPDAQSLAVEPILVGPPPRNLTAQRIYRS